MSRVQAPSKFDAILVAGEGESSYKIYNQHKSFLKINGKCIVNYVIEALQKVESVRTIYIVGLKEKLLKTLKEEKIDLNFPKPIVVVEQKSNLYENIWHTFLKTLPNEGDIPDLERSEFSDRAVLIVPCDSPLITSHEVEYFIQKCDLEKHDHVLGLVTDKTLSYFYPRDNVPGIKMAYLYLKENVFRINNLHLVKPLKMLNRKYIKEMYQYRYQRNIKNIIPFALKLIGKDNPVRFRYYFGLQFCLLFSRYGMERLVKFIRSWTPKLELEQCVSKIMGTRLSGIEVPFPGAALDIDNDRDYETIKLRFNEWQDYLSQLERDNPLPFRSESIV